MSAPISLGIRPWDDVKAYVDAAVAVGGGGGGGSGLPNTLILSAQTGSTTDQKIANAKSAALTQAQIPPILFNLPFWTINASVLMAAGLKFMGNPGDFSDNMRTNSGHATSAVRIKAGPAIGLSIAAMFRWNGGTFYDGGFANLTFEGSGSQQLFHCPLTTTTTGGAAANAFGVSFHNIGAKGFKHVWGNTEIRDGSNNITLHGNAFTNTLNTFTGYSYLQSTIAPIGIFAGSDSRWSYTIANIGSDGAGSTEPFSIFIFQGQIKSRLYNLYITAAKYQRAIEIQGSELYCHDLTFTGCELEGQNGDANPSYGELIRKSGTGNATFRDSSIAYGLAGYPAGGGHAAAPAQVNVLAGLLLFDGCSSKMTEGHTPTSEPFASVAAGAKIRVRNHFANIEPGSAAWSGALPRVVGAGSCNGDDTINDLTTG